MGRKSRAKRERRVQKEHGLTKGSSMALLRLGEHNNPIYRFFQEEWQAEALVRGEVWLSTLKKCRTYEDPQQGDPEEAHETYNSGHAVGGGDDPDFVEVGRRSGIDIGADSSNIILNNNTRKTVLHDAYVLCTTTEFSSEVLSETFGNYCVKISDPKEFFLLVSASLVKDKCQIREAGAGQVIYRDRSYTGLESPPGPIGFVKPLDRYAPQKEFRFLWVPEDSTALTPFLLKSPLVAHLCTRVI